MKTGSSKNELPPLSRLYGLVCGFYNWSKETTPRSQTSFRWAVFEGRLRRRDFFEPVWVSQASETEVPCTNPLHLTSSMTRFKGWFSLKN